MNAPELAAAAAEASPWLTVREAAARAKVSTKLIYGSVTAGRLKAARLGATQRHPDTSVVARRLDGGRDDYQSGRARQQ